MHDVYKTTYRVSIRLRTSIGTCYPTRGTSGARGIEELSLEPVLSPVDPMHFTTVGRRVATNFAGEKLSMAEQEICVALGFNRR